jgi:hypothetical protein
MFMK